MCTSVVNKILMSVVKISKVTDMSHYFVKNCPIVFCRLALLSPLTSVDGLAWN